MEKISGEAEAKEVKTVEQESSPTEMDPVFVSVLLQPSMSHHDPNYVVIHRLLHSKAQSLLQRKDWKCNNKSDTAYQNFIRKPMNWESQITKSQPSTPSHRSANELANELLENPVSFAPLHVYRRIQKGCFQYREPKEATGKQELVVKMEQSPE